MADDRKPRVRNAVRSRRKSINEKHFAATAGKPSARLERKPVFAAADGKLVSVTYQRIRTNGGDLILSAAALNRTPALTMALALAFTSCFRSNRPAKVVANYWGYLGEFAESVARSEPGIDFENLERRHLSGFIDWLDSRNADGSAVRNKGTRSNAVLIVQRILRQTGSCGHIDFIKRPYSSVGGRNLRTAKRTPRRRVPKPEEARSLLLAALREIRETMTLHDAMNDPAHPLREDDTMRRTLLIACDMRAEYGHTPPGVAICTRIAKRHGGDWEDAKRAASAYLPTLSALAPFCIVLMIALRLDGQMISDLLAKNLSVVQSLGLDRLQAKVWRSKVKDWKTLTAALSAHWHSPEKLVAFLDGWSRDLRAATGGKTGDLQFIIAPFGAERANDIAGKGGIGACDQGVLRAQRPAGDHDQHPTQAGNRTWRHAVVGGCHRPCPDRRPHRTGQSRPLRYLGGGRAGATTPTEWGSCSSHRIDSITARLPTSASTCPRRT